MPAALDRAFLDDIVAHPGDVAPRLIYADWLDDHGDPDRAEFIRVQIALASLAEDDPARHELQRREQALFAAHAEWYDVVPGWAGEPIFHRGFVEQVERVSHADLAAHGPDLWSARPIRQLSVHGPWGSGKAFDRPVFPPGLTRLWLNEGIPTGALSRLARHSLPALRDFGLSHVSLSLDDARRLAEGPLLAGVDSFFGNFGETDAPGLATLLERAAFRSRLRVLNLQSTPLHGDLGELLATLHLPALTRLALPFSPVAAGLVGRLLDSVRRPGLTDLDLSGARLTPDDVQALAARPELARLRTLTLRWNAELAPAVSRDLLRSPHLGRLERLDLDSTGMGDAAAEAIAKCPALAGLRHLSLGSSRIGTPGVTALARSPHLRRLRTLHLSLHRIDDAGVEAFVRHVDMPELTTLSLGGDVITARGIRAVAGCERLGGLVHFSFGSGRAGPDGARAIAESPHLRRLGTLSLYWCELGDDGVAALAASPNLAGTWRLYLAGNGIGRAGAEALARSPHLRTVTNLALPENAIPADAEAALTARFGRYVTFAH